MSKKKKDRDQKRKPKYGIFSCVRYIYGLLWENARFLVFVGLGVVPLSLLAAAFGLYASPAINSLAGLLSGIAWRFQQVKVGSAQISDIREFLEYKGKLNRGPGIALPEKPFSIEFKNASFRYPKGEKTFWSMCHSKSSRAGKSCLWD